MRSPPPHRSTPARRLWLLPLLGLCGCAGSGNWPGNGFKVGPEHETPDVQLEDHWIDFDDPALISESHSADEAEWWQTLEDPVLDRLVTEIREQNLTLAGAAERIRSAQAVRRVAIGNLLPQKQVLETSFSYNRQSATAYPFDELDRRLDDPFFQEVYQEDYDQYTAGGAVQWELDLWGRYRRAIEAATAALEAAEYRYHDVEISLIASTVDAYVQFRELQHRLALAENNAKAQERVLEIARARVRSGATTELDENEAMANLTRTLSRIPILRIRLREENNLLCILRGSSPVDVSKELGTGTIPSVPAAVTVGLPTDLLRRRPDVRAAERRLAEQCARIGIAAAEYFPALILQGSLRLESANADDLFDSDSRAGEIWPRLQWNVLNYGRIGNTVRAQEAKYAELLQEYQYAVLQANAEAENAIYTFLQARTRLRILEQAVKASDRSVEIAARQYSAGTIPFGRLSVLQSIQVNQQDEAAQARANVVRAFVRLYRALGGAGSPTEDDRSGS